MKKIPLHSLVLIHSPNSLSKSQLATHKFKSFEILNFDKIKEELVGDSNRTDINHLAYHEIFYKILQKLKLGERVVCDFNNLKVKERFAITKLGRDLGLPIYYIIDNELTPDTNLTSSQKESIKFNDRDILKGDGFATVIDSRKEDFQVIEKPNLINMKEYIKSLGYKGITVVGDVHGMKEALKSTIDWAASRNHYLIYLGDIVDHGHDNISCIEIIYDLVMRGKAFLIKGNHENKLEKWLDQIDTGAVRVKLSEANKLTTDAIISLPSNQKTILINRFRALMNLAKNHLIVGNTLFTHAAAEPEMFDIYSHRLKGHHESMALYGEIHETYKTKDNGYPNRIYNWVTRIPENKQVIVGHDIRSYQRPVTVKNENNGVAVFMDTGSAKGGLLSSADISFEGETLVIKNFVYH